MKIGATMGDIYISAGVVIALAMGLLVPGAAGAATLTAVDILGRFNLITSGGAATQSDIEGAAVIGGDLGSSGTFFNNAGRLPANPTVYLFGANTGSYNIDNGGHVVFGSNPGHFNLNGGATAVQGSFPGTYPNVLSDYLTPLQALSMQLAQTAANSGVAVGSNTITFNAVANAQGTAVFNFTAAQLQAQLRSNIVFNRGAGVTAIVIDVTGDFSEPGGVNWNTPAQDVLFNFSDANTVALGNWEGSVLAPHAAVRLLSGNFEGALFASSFGGGGELHNLAFTGALPAPEPAGWAVLGVAVVGLMAARGRRRRPTTLFRF